MKLKESSSSIISFFSFLSFESLLLVGCNDEQTLSTKELVFLEKSTEFDYPLFIFECLEDKKYYAIEVSNWEYDNESFESGEKLIVETKKVKENDHLGAALFNTKGDFAELTGFRVSILDEWRRLFELTDYKKSE